MKLTLMACVCCVMVLSSQLISSSATVVAEENLAIIQATSQEKAAFTTDSNSPQQSSEAMKESKGARVPERLVSVEEEEIASTTHPSSAKAKLLRFLLSKLHVRHLSRYYRQAVTDDVAKRNRYMNYLRLITVLGLSIIYFFVMNSQL